jgi:hypothetical protein
MTKFMPAVSQEIAVIALSRRKCSNQKTTRHRNHLVYNASLFFRLSIMNDVKLTKYRVSTPLVLTHVALITAMMLVMVLSLPAITIPA